VTYTCDAEGRRVRRTLGGQSVEWIYDLAGRVIAEFSDATQSVTRTEVYGPDHVATYSNSATYFIHSDWLGTERGRSGVNGALVESFTSLPFGDPASISNGLSPLHFTGQEHDAESNLEHFWFRQYSSTLARWMTPDPAGLAAANPANPQSWNRYAYVLNNPLLFVDPDGRNYAFYVDGAPASASQFFSLIESGAAYPAYTTAGPCSEKHGQIWCGTDEHPLDVTAWLNSIRDNLATTPLYANTTEAFAAANNGTPPCRPSSQLNIAERGLFNALSFWANLTGTSYSVSIGGSRTFGKVLGATVGASRTYAADPTGGQAIITSAYFQASVTPGGAAAGYVQVGAATYPTVQGYAGPSTGGDFLYAPGFAVGGGYASNASGVQTFATIGYGVGARVSGGPSGSVGTQMVTICQP